MSGRFRDAARVALICALGACDLTPPPASHVATAPVAAAREEKGKAMQDAFYDPLLEQPVAIDVAPTPIAPSREPSTLPRASPGEVGFVRAFGDDGLTSRAGAALPRGTWRERRSTPLDTGVEPVLVLTAGDRIVLQGQTSWSLHGLDLASLAHGSLARGGVTLDPASGLFYLEDSNGMILAHKLADGTRAFALPMSFGAEYERRLIARRGRRLLVVSSPRALDPHAGEVSGASMIELADLGSPPRPDNAGLLDSAVVEAAIAHRSPRLPAALRGDGVVVAIAGGIGELDAGLRVRRLLTGDFAPVALSLDETGRAYLLADSGGKRALWLVTPQGSRAYARELPPALQRAFWPPAVGYDHVAWVIAAEQVLAVGTDGSVLREWTAPARVAGAVATADGALLIAAGGEIFALGSSGPARPLHAFAGEQVRTAPIPTRAGGVVVATNKRLVELASP